jgi:hypothetical protein
VSDDDNNNRAQDLASIPVAKRWGGAGVSIRRLGRGYGIVVSCNRCGTTKQTANLRVDVNRDAAKRDGWGRGSDPGCRSREARPATPRLRLSDGRIQRARTARPERIGRPSTKAHDLCPKCLKLDRDAAKARKATRAAQIAARDAIRKLPMAQRIEARKARDKARHKANRDAEKAVV